MHKITAKERETLWLYKTEHKTAIEGKKRGLCLYKMDQKYTKEDGNAIQLKERLVLYLEY